MNHPCKPIFHAGSGFHARPNFGVCTALQKPQKNQRSGIFMTLINNQNISINSRTSIILGNFDGVHLAHQRLFSLAKQRSDELQIKSLAFTFNPHPQEFFGGREFKSITTAEERRLLISQSGIDYVVEYPFDEKIQMMEPEQFFKEILVDELNAKVITVGEDHRFGKERKGNSRLLFNMCEKYDVELNIMPDMLLGKDIISSTAVRKYIREGKLSEATNMLGRAYLIIDTVSKGRALGRSIGFPTINFKSKDAKLYPPDGVYVTQTEILNEKYKSVTNIGSKPTVGGTEVNIETHLLDFNGDAYNQPAVVFFHERIRGEKKFNTVQELSRQIAKDIEHVIKFFNRIGDNV